LLVEFFHLVVMGVSSVLLFWKSPWFHRSYIGDYVAVAVLVIASLVIQAAVTPFARTLPAADIGVASYPLKADIVPDWVVPVVALIIPILIFLCFQIYVRSVHDLHNATLGLGCAMSLTLLITTVLKFLTGRPRPDALALGGKDAHESFPSGHSSESFAGLTFLSLYLAAKWHVFALQRLEDKTVVHKGSFVTGLGALFPLVVAGFIAVSRTMDYHHNFSDVLAGSVLGAGIACWAYLLFYPPLTSFGAHLPITRTPAEGSDTSLPL